MGTPRLLAQRCQPRPRAGCRPRAGHVPPAWTARPRVPLAPAWLAGGFGGVHAAAFPQGRTSITGLDGEARGLWPAPGLATGLAACAQRAGSETGVGRVAPALTPGCGAVASERARRPGAPALVQRRRPWGAEMGTRQRATLVTCPPSLGTPSAREPWPAGVASFCLRDAGAATALSET